MGVDPLMVQSSELMRIGKMPKASEIKSGKVSFWSLRSSPFRDNLGCGRASLPDSC